MHDIVVTGSQEEWTGMCMREQWLHCTSQWGQQTLLSEHVYCVVVTYKMTEQVEQWICIKCVVKLEYSFRETIQVIQKAVAMGNWWLAALSQQCGHPRITSCTKFFGGTSNLPGDSALLQTRFGALGLLTFPKTKITLGRDEISDCQWDSGNYKGTADGDWENRMTCLLWNGLRHHCPMYSVSCIFFNKCLYFLYYMAGYLLDRPHNI